VWGLLVGTISDRQLIMGLEGLRPGTLAGVFAAVFCNDCVREGLLAASSSMPLAALPLRSLLKVGLQRIRFQSRIDQQECVIFDFGLKNLVCQSTCPLLISSYSMTARLQ
jgi:hypothetical protein